MRTRISLFIGLLIIGLGIAFWKDTGVITLPDQSAIKKSSNLYIKAKMDEQKSKTKTTKQDEILNQYNHYLYSKTYLDPDLGCTKKEKNPMTEIPYCVQYEKFSDFYPRFPQCINKYCIYTTFVLERIEKNSELKNAILQAILHRVYIDLSNEFAVSIDLVKINVNADDKTIIDFLTKDAEITNKKN